MQYWEIVEGCGTKTTKPAIYRASMVSGKTELLRSGTTCDGEEFTAGIF
jgi:hypothetical protein